jgi:hypothetical protein
MKNLKFLILTLAIVLYSCERDDICTNNTPTTPALIIEFFDVTEIEELKSVIRMSAYAETLVLDENDILVPPTASDNKSIVFNSATGLTSLTLPLIIGTEDEEQITRYALERDTDLRLDTNTATNSNIDILEMRYITELVYVSRACGFKSIFKNLSVRIISDGDNWIRSSIPGTTETITVENENQTHVQLFH